MDGVVALRTGPVATVRDLVELGKPRVTTMVVFTAAIGLWMADVAVSLPTTVAFLVATGLLVASANTLNCYVERDTDALMLRTRDRPLASGRLAPGLALVSGMALGLVALATLVSATNLLTAALGLFALLTYVLVYTPMKRRSPWALHVGAVPGAIPPLMGYTAATGAIALPGAYLFLLLLFWQLPHFIAIAYYLRDDYRRGGLRVLPVVVGDDASRMHLLGTSVALLGFSLLAPAVGLAGGWYALVAAVAGGRFVWIAARGVRDRLGSRWARRVFLESIVWLVAVVTALLLDAR